MGKESGLGAGLFLDGVDISNDTGAVNSINKGMNTIEMTGIDKRAIERVHGGLTGAIETEHFFNPTGAHPVLASLPRTDRIISYFHRKATLGTPVASMVLKQESLDNNREADGKFMFPMSTESNGFWLDWGYSLSAGPRTDTGAAFGSTVDFGADAPGLYNAQAYLHVTAFTGTSATIKVQTSTDNNLDPFTDRITFPNVTAGPIALRATQAVPPPLVMERWARIAISGTFTSITYLVALTINRTDQNVI